MTYLELAQAVARESGTITYGYPLSGAGGGTERIGKVGVWVNDAWRSIQNAHEGWLWQRSDFSGPTVAAQREYTGVELGVASRFGEFLYDGSQNENRYSIYLTATGVSDEGQLQYKPYDEFFTVYMRGTQTNSRPSMFTITPAGKLALHPIPDAVYTVKGPYRKDLQVLSADGDIPEMPTRFHNIIVDAALIRLGTHDEAPVQIPLWRLRQFEEWGMLEQSQLPKMTFPGALA